MDELEYFQGDDLAASTWRNKYALEGEKNPDDMHKRIAKELARVHAKYKDRKDFLNEEYVYEILKDFKYIILGGSGMEGIGSHKLISLSNCFVIAGPKDDYASIMKARAEQVQLMMRRGGVGWDISGLRPKGAIVHNAAKTSSGAPSFLNVNSELTKETSQDGRRGALMQSLDIRHPDIVEFIAAKQDTTKIEGANLSVQVTDDFIRSAHKKEDYILRWPCDCALDIKALGDLSLYKYGKLYNTNTVTDADEPIYIKRVDAGKIWELLMQSAWQAAEPGVLFVDTIHNYSPDGVYPKYRMVCTNPCGR